jgi:putative tryptophan/tyrosine transport system substrate-binding protein
MDRRNFIGMVCGTLAALPPSTRAQRAEKVWRIGILSIGNPSSTPSAVLRQAFQELGYVQERNVAYVGRAAGGRIERLPELATELVGLGVDVIITFGSEATRAAKQATASIPIVFLGPSYPIEEGLVASFARPGGNVTGITAAQSDHVLKPLQILRDAVPTLAEVAVIWTPANPGSTLTLRDMESGAGPLLMKIQSVPIAGDDDVGPALAAISRLRPGALIVLPSALLFPHAQRVGELALKLRIPSISAQKRDAEQGLLFSYGADTRELERRVAGYVDRLFKGARPADLPVERPTKFELTVNMKTAKAIGLTIPQSLLVRADATIE